RPGGRRRPPAGGRRGVHPRRSRRLRRRARAGGEGPSRARTSRSDRPDLPRRLAPGHTGSRGRLPGIGAPAGARVRPPPGRLRRRPRRPAPPPAAVLRGPRRRRHRRRREPRRRVGPGAEAGSEPGPPGRAGGGGAGVVIGSSDVVRREDRLRQLEMAVTRKLDGLLQGDHQGLVPGGGAEPAESRVYAPGDDVRRMDWNLTARTAVPHVRTTIADRELETWLVVDGSASLDFGTAACEKRDLALAAAAAFTFLTVRGGNRVAASLFGPDAAVVPPRSGRSAALALLRRLEQRGRATGGPSTTVAEALRRIRLTAKRRGLVVLITDLIDESPWQRELRALALRHEVVVVEVRDPRESSLPAVGLLMLVDPETGQRLEVQTSNPKVRARFAEAAAARQAEHARLVQGTGAAHLVLSTDRDWLFDIVRFVVARRRRR